jgi:MYXO-CTERM domain-containing protein
MLRVACVLAVLCVLSPPPARADVVGPDERECPSGFPHQRCHGAEYCAITPCTADAQCATGSSCAEQRWCVWKLDCGSRYRPDGYVPSYVYGFEGSCAAGEACGRGSCETIRACTPLPERGCSCRLGSDAPLRAPSILLLGLALLALARRRR